MMTASELCTYGKAFQERAEEFARKRRIDLVDVDWNGNIATDLERLNMQFSSSASQALTLEAPTRLILIS
jgi:hypothetical protein